MYYPVYCMVHINYPLFVIPERVAHDILQIETLGIGTLVSYK